MRHWLAVIAVLGLLLGGLGSAVASPSSGPNGGPASVGFAAPIPTPNGPHPSTIYTTRNLDSQTINVRHTIASDTGTVVYEFTDTLAVGQTHEFHVKDMAQVPDPFAGSVTLVVDNYTVDPPLEALVSGYDYRPFVGSLPVIRR